MATTIVCSACHGSLSVSPAHFGKRVRCPHCRQVVHVANPPVLSVVRPETARHPARSETNKQPPPVPSAPPSDPPRATLESRHVSMPVLVACGGGASILSVAVLALAVYFG